MRLSRFFAFLALTVSALALAHGAAAQELRAPVPVPLDPATWFLPDLVVSGSTWQNVTIKNTGRFATGGFSIRVARGYQGGECYDDPVPPIVRFVPGLAWNASITVPVTWSSTARTVRLDATNAVMEHNELNNTGTIPGAGYIVC